MKAKKFFASVLLFMLFTTAANAKVTAQQALSDQRIAPYVELTRQYGKDFFPGRYAHVKEIISRVNSNEKIYAASSLIIEVGQFNPENNAYPSNFDVYGENLAPVYMTFDASGEVPVIKTYAADDAGNYEVIAEDYAVVMPEDSEKYAWLFASVETGEIRYLYPLNNFWFPSKWYEGEWKCSDGSEIELEDDGEIEIQDKKFGTYIISDNRIAVKTPDGQRDVIYCANNPYDGTLVMTFTSGPNGMGENAGVFTKVKDKAPTAPKFPGKTSTTAPTQPKFPGKTDENPSPFPKFPGKAPEANIEGVWQTYMNGQQIVLQFQGNNYYMWLNGQPMEMGSFQRDGNVLNGRKSTGEAFRNTVQVDQAGRTLILSDTNNFSMTYQKVQ